MSAPLIDQAARDQLERGHESNISVIAPAGVGKTTSIVNRIVHLAKLPETEAIERLSRLVVVTYSVRAAQEMQQRARVAIRNAALSTESEPVSMRVQRAFQQTFFGTIHSFCVRLLERFGHFLGLPTPVGLLQDEEEIWRRFLLRGLDPSIGRDPHLRELFNFYSPEQLYRLGRMLPPGDLIATEPLPNPDISSLLRYDPSGLHTGTKKTIVKAQTAAQAWADAWERNERYHSLPYCPDSDKAAPYIQLYRQAFAPLSLWLHETARAFGRRIANAYEDFRLSEAVMTYDDQIRLALRVLKLPTAQRELAEDGYSVLLDEAQDTDPLQFEVLRRVAGHCDDLEQADSQNLSIVGDFQQAIYAPRSDLATYQSVHDEIKTRRRGTTTSLEVTFRCKVAIIDFVNRIFPAILNNAGGQADFVPLKPKVSAGPGQVIRIMCPELPAQEEDAKIKAAHFYEHEAEFVAQRIREAGYAGLGARNWSQVAVLCPRKNWLLDLRHALVEQDLRVQLHSSDETPRDRMTGSWLTALIWIAAHPEDSFEIAGVLREVLGIADSDMALFTEGEGDRLRLDRPVEGKGIVARALQQLRGAIAGADEMPLGQAVSQMVQQTQLRERLRSIPDVDVEDLDRELDDFLAVVAARSADGTKLADLAHDLRSELAQTTVAEEEIHEDAIQLMTSHKSKGLEWDAVVVPYLFRRIEWKNATYPRVVTLTVDDLIICRDKDEYNERARDLVTMRERQQAQRLYYVTFTRAKRTLVLFDDEALMANLKSRPGEIAGEFLQFTSGANRDSFHGLPETLTLSPEPTRPTSTQESDIASIPALAEKDLDLAIKRAKLFPRRTTPHALAVHTRHTESDAEPEQQFDREEDHAPEVVEGSGIFYGTWWHEFVETIPWREPRAIWQQKFIEAHARSPQPERSTREWELFCQSDLARWLAEPDRLIQVELPFLWRNSGQSCHEGIMDLAVYATSESTWHVIDWKTNQVGPDGSAGIVAVYRDQIGAYVTALRQILSAEVRGSLYLTQTGAWEKIE